MKIFPQQGQFESIGIVFAFQQPKNKQTMFFEVKKSGKLKICLCKKVKQFTATSQSYFDRSKICWHHFDTSFHFIWSSRNQILRLFSLRIELRKHSNKRWRIPNWLNSLFKVKYSTFKKYAVRSNNIFLSWYFFEPQNCHWDGELTTWCAFYPSNLGINWVLLMPILRVFPGDCFDFSSNFGKTKPSDLSDQ